MVQKHDTHNFKIEDIHCQQLENKEYLDPGEVTLEMTLGFTPSLKYIG